MMMFPPSLWMKPGKLFQLFASTWTCSSRWWINDGTTSPKGQVFVAKLKIAKENLEIAATEEDFDRAAWLQEANLWHPQVVPFTFQNTSYQILCLVMVRVKMTA
jgi:hypothetical protein